MILNKKGDNFLSPFYYYTALVFIEHILYYQVQWSFAS